MSFVIGFGPLDENETTNGDISSFVSVLFIIVAFGFLCINYYKKCNTNKFNMFVDVFLVN